MIAPAKAGCLLRLSPFLSGSLQILFFAGQAAFCADKQLRSFQRGAHYSMIRGGILRPFNLPDAAQ